MDSAANGIRKKYDRIVWADRVVRPYKKSVVVRIAGDSERREQSETLFRIVVTIATDG